MLLTSSKARAFLLVMAGVLLGIPLGTLGLFRLTTEVAGTTMASSMTHYGLVDAEEHLGLARELSESDSAALRQRLMLLLGADLPFLQSACRNQDSIDHQSACSLLHSDVAYLRTHPFSTGRDEFDAMVHRIELTNQGCVESPASAGTSVHP